MPELNWVKHPGNKDELFIASADFAEEVMATADLPDELGDLDVTANDVVRFAAAWSQKHSEQLEQWVQEDPVRGVAFAYTLGLVTGMRYKEKDDHTWKDDA